MSYLLCTTEYTHQSSTDKNPSIELTISFSGLPHSPTIPTQEAAPVRQPASLVNTTFVQDGQTSAVDQAASDAEALRSPPGFEATSKVIDAATQLVGPVKLAIGVADSLTGVLECLSEARGYMDGIVELVKTFADVRLHLLCRFSVIQPSSHQIHPILTVGVKALTTIYDVSMLVKVVESLYVQLVIPLCQLVKKQGDRDENIKALAAAMRDMLASLSEIQELEKIKLLQNAVDVATSRMDECAEFVKVYARHGFWGGFV